MSKIESMRAEMYRLSEGQDPAEAVASVRQMSERMDKLIYRFMCCLRNSDAHWNENAS